VLRRIFGELKRRNVLRVAGVYVVSGWALFQIVNSLFPVLRLPMWSVTLVAALFLIGLPIVVIIAYAFESTPGGLKRTPAADAATPMPKLGWFDWTLFAASVVIVGFAVAQFAMTEHASRSESTQPAETASNASVAVLPFVNFSSLSDGEYFADGLTEELINSLAQLPDLKVAGRTSAFYFKGRNEDLREIGRKLGVAHVLEGSVRSAGERLRITAQLIKVADGFHLWSETYDRPMSDVLAIQTQIADAVAEVLKARILGPTNPDATQPARNPRAYQLELIAQGQLRKHELEEMQKARASYEELLKLEPDNPRALAGYADATIFLAQDFLALDFDTARQESEAAIDRALTIAPQSAAAWRVKGVIDHIIAIRSSEARYSDLAMSALRKAVEIDPKDSESLELLANQLYARGQSAESTALLQRALALDPLSRLAQELLGVALEGQGRFSEARRQYESLIDLYPDFTTAKISLAELLRTQGKLDEAAELLDDDKLMRTDPLSGFLLANCYLNLGMVNETTETLERIREPPPAAAVAHAALLLHSRQIDALSAYAKEQLDTTRDPIWSSIAIVSRVVANDVPAARASLSDAVPGLLETPPATEQYDALDALVAAYALRESGWPEQATQIARDVLASHESPPHEFVPVETTWLRALAFAVLDQTDDAIAELRRATDDGYRTLYDFDYFVRLDDYPFMAHVAADPRFQAIVTEIEADNRRMRDALVARRDKLVERLTTP
jgi:TolB-like protein/Tfp pilus assembly protein PilF